MRRGKPYVFPANHHDGMSSSHHPAQDAQIPALSAKMHGMQGSQHHDCTRNLMMWVCEAERVRWSCDKREGGRMIAGMLSCLRTVGYASGVARLACRLPRSDYA